MFAAAVFRGEVTHHQCVKSGTEQMEHLMRWYLEASGYNAQEEGQGRRAVLDKPSVGFFQVGGGIAGDFAICAVPAMVQDLQMEDVPFWGYFAQISRRVDELRRLLGRGAEREDHLGQARRRHAEVHDPVGRDDRGAADVCVCAE